MDMPVIVPRHSGYVGDRRRAAMADRHASSGVVAVLQSRALPGRRSEFHRSPRVDVVALAGDAVGRDTAVVEDVRIRTGVEQRLDQPKIQGDASLLPRIEFVTDAFASGVMPPRPRRFTSAPASMRT